jgi:glycogen debranching enzyme
MLNSLESIARRSLEGNVVALRSGSFLTAGGHQFRSLWTRDFAFAARGLLRLGRHDVVRDQLSLLIRSARPKDGLVPRTFDSKPIGVRVAVSAVSNLVGLKASLGISDRLKPGYIDGHGSPAIDSNLLTILTALDYVQKSGDRAWWRSVERDLIRIWRFYDGHLQDGLIVQPRFSDWQDSVRRAGKTFYTNLLYHTVAQRLVDRPGFGVTRSQVDELRRKVVDTFYDPGSGLFRSVAGRPQVSLDGNLLAIDLGFVADARKQRALYRSLQHSELWTRHGLPGYATAPDYPRSWPSLTVRVVGLDHYHDELFWSWLMALSAKVAHRMGDGATETRLLTRLDQLARRDGSIAEIYAPRPDLPLWRSPLYTSETPFSWGAGMVIDACEEIRGSRRR